MPVDTTLPRHTCKSCGLTVHAEKYQRCMDCDERMDCPDLEERKLAVPKAIEILEAAAERAKGYGQTTLHYEITAAIGWLRKVI